MQFECVGSIFVNDIRSQIRRQFYDGHSITRALLAAIDTNRTGIFGDDHAFVIGYLNTSLAATSYVALEVTKGFRVRFYFLLVNDHNSSRLIVVHSFGFTVDLSN